MTGRAAVIALLAAASLSAAAGAVATADVAGPDDSIAQAFGPMRPGVWYPGAFVRTDDVDHLAIVVAQPDTALHVDVENTVGTCTSPDLTGCPIWATLVDGQAQQVGGEGSSAGTGRVDAGASDVVDWTFARPGTYFLAMDSAGDLPTYRVRQTQRTPAPAPGEPGAGGPIEPAPGGGATTLPAASLSVAARQRGTAVRGRLHVRRELRRVTISVRHATTTYASLRLDAVRAGRRSVSLRLGPAGRRALARAGRVRLTVRMVATPATGSRLVVRRPVTLTRPAAP